MTSKKYFPNVVYANHDANPLAVVAGKACFSHKICAVAKIFINSAPVIYIIKAA